MPICHTQSDRGSAILSRFSGLVMSDCGMIPKYVRPQTVDSLTSPNGFDGFELLEESLMRGERE